MDREIDDDAYSLPSSDSDDSIVIKGKQRSIRAKEAVVHDSGMVRGKSSFLPAISFTVNSLRPAVPSPAKLIRRFAYRVSSTVVSDDSDPESEPETRYPKVCTRDDVPWAFFRAIVVHLAPLSPLGGF
jgi:hypothetical protein